MSFKIDIDDVLAAERAADRELGGNMGARMQRVVQRSGAAEAQRNHGYRNRTGNLESSTGAYLTESTPSRIVVRLEPLAEYAQFVADRGFLSLDRSGRMSEAALTGFFAQQAGKLSA